MKNLSGTDILSFITFFGLLLFATGLLTGIIWKGCFEEHYNNSDYCNLKLDKIPDGFEIVFDGEYYAVRTSVEENGDDRFLCKYRSGLICSWPKSVDEPVKFTQISGAKGFIKAYLMQENKQNNEVTYKKIQL